MRETGPSDALCGAKLSESWRSAQRTNVLSAHCRGSSQKSTEAKRMYDVGRPPGWGPMSKNRQVTTGRGGSPALNIPQGHIGAGHPPLECLKPLIEAGHPLEKRSQPFMEGPQKPLTTAWGGGSPALGRPGTVSWGGSPAPGGTWGEENGSRYSLTYC